MADIYEIIDKLLLENGISGAKMSSDLGMSRSFMTELRKGRAKGIKVETAQKIAEYFNVSIDYLLGEEEFTDPNCGSKGIKIPVLGYVRAGIPIDVVEDILDYEEIDPAMARRGDFFALQIKGDSMSPRIQDGDVVIIRKQSDIDSGDVAVVLINGDEATIKKVIKGPKGIVLQAFNPSYDPIFFSNADIEEKPVSIMGKVVELRGKFF